MGWVLERQRRTAPIAICLLAGVASASPLVHKPPPKGLPIEAARAYAEALAFEREGRFGDAVRSYASVNRIVPTPAAYYNTAADWIEVGNTPLAFEALLKYVHLVPADEPEIQKVVATLRPAQPEVTIGAEHDGDIDPRALILLDGVVLGPSPQTRVVAPGNHLFERIAPGQYYGLESMVRDNWYFGLLSNEVRPGNVILSIRSMGWQRWNDTGIEMQSNTLFSLPVGHYKTRADNHRMCEPIEFDVAATDEVTYVSVRATEAHDHQCAKVEKVAVQRLLKGVK